MTKLEWHTEQRIIKDLIPYQFNPRKLSEMQTKQLRESIEKFNLVDIPAIDADDIIVSGHQRLKIMIVLGRGDETIDVRVPNRKLTDAEFKEYLVRANKNTGEFDFKMLGENFEVGMLTDIGFSEMELGIGLDERPEDDEVPSVTASVSRLGDLYVLGGVHNVLCGDATSKDDVSRLMAGNVADMVFTDPPYNVSYVGKTKEGMTIQNDTFSDKQKFYDFLLDSMLAMKPHVRGDVYIAMSSSELHTLQKAFEDAGGHWSTFIIWVKNTFTLGRSNYQRQYEPILYGWFDKTSHYWSGRRNLGDVVQNGVRMDEDGSMWVKVHQGGIESEIWHVNKPSRNKEHPTMKPVDLIGRAILNSSMPKAIVLDAFLGSGSTVICCEKLHRKCYGIELDPHYVDVIVNRWCKYTGTAKVMKNGEMVDWAISG